MFCLFSFLGPNGGDCSYPVAWNDIQPKFGWWKIPEKERIANNSREVFAECLYAPACLGGINKKLADRHFEARTSTLHPNMTCSVALGFKNFSRLCHSCSNGYKRKGTNRCALCPPNQSDNWLLIMGGGFVMFIVLAVISGDAVNQAGKQTLSASIQKILLNYLQVVTLFSAFPLRWPKELEFLFEVQGAISTVGEHLLNPDCLTTSASGAVLYYSKQQMFAVLPVIIACISFLIWYMYGVYSNHSFFKVRTSSTHTTPKDKFIITFTTILYLLYPTLCKNAFGLFDCKLIGGKYFLKIDLEEECYTGRHWNMMIFLGVGQLILYVIGLPLVVYVILHINRGTLKDHVTLARYGLFYGSYKTDRFFWVSLISINLGSYFLY